MNAELLEFTRRALEQGITRERVRDVLKAVGWGEPDIDSAVGAFVELDFPLAVPRPRPYLSAQEVFTYALFFTALYVSAFNLVALVFQFIDLVLPPLPTEPLGGPPFSATRAYDSMRANIAALLVAFPLFLFLFRLIHREIARDPTKRQSRPRKWLTYLTLFVAASALIGDLSSLFYKLLGGDLTSRFLLKVATVALIAGGAFSYFLADIRQDERS